MFFSKFSVRSFALTSLAAVAVAGCGGVDYLFIRGVAAEGPALAGATVTATCTGGASSVPVTTNADGSYSVAVVDGAAPCIVTATRGGVSYQAVTAGSGSALTVNVTPISTIVVELLKKEFVGAGASALALINNASAQAALAGSTSTFSEAIASAMTTAAAAGNPIASALTSQFSTAELQAVLTGSFTPATSSSAGDAIDGKLDLVVAQLTTGGFISSGGAVNTAAVQEAVAAIDVPLTGSTGATGGTGATGATGVGN